VERRKLTRKANRGQWTDHGDYWIGSDGKVILACPYCNTVSYCPHQVVCAEPLTLNPSVIEHSCEHHFMVIGGYAQ